MTYKSVVIRFRHSMELEGLLVSWETVDTKLQTYKSQWFSLEEWINEENYQIRKFDEGFKRSRLLCSTKKTQITPSHHFLRRTFPDLTSFGTNSDVQSCYSGWRSDEKYSLFSSDLRTHESHLHESHVVTCGGGGSLSRSCGKQWDLKNWWAVRKRTSV